MAPFQRRRLLSVNCAKRLINAVLYIRQQKQIPNFDRISRYLQRFADISQRKIQEYLDNAVSDGILIEYTTTGVKGQRVGLEQEGYRIPQIEEVAREDDGHDWYCFECHGPGDVYNCNDCFRVYHRSCTKENTNREVFTCSLCRACKKKSRLDKKMLNLLLSYVVVQLRQKARDLYKIGSRISPKDMKQFVYEEMDLSLMEQKVQALEYRCIEEFLADAQTILHNCMLVFGGEKDSLAELSASMVKYCKYDLDEIELCPDCYYMSNAKPDDWFSQPCNPPHVLVYAKQKGCSYWPAKIIRNLGNRIDVRYFGGWHERGMVPAEKIKPINTDISSLALKKSGNFQKAMEELKRYMEIEEERNQRPANDGQEIIQLDDDEMKEEMEVREVTNKEKASRKEIVKKQAIKESPHNQNKKSLKRMVESTCDSDYEDEVDRRQVTSTSVEKLGKKWKKQPSQSNSSSDELHTVTSSVDKVTASPIITTAVAAVQTPILRTENIYTQTDTIKQETRVPVCGSPVSEKICGRQQLSDQVWEEKIAIAMADLSKELQKKFDEERDAAMRELSCQLEEDFGRDKHQAIERTIASMKVEVEKARRVGEDRAREQYMEEMKKLAVKHKDAISQIKKKQWCQYCEEEAMYHCCWNTSYCSVKCQQEHWHKEHKKVCRRKRT